MENIEKVLNGLEMLAKHSGNQLKIEVYMPQNIWLIKISAGDAVVQASLVSFVKVPQIMLDPFGDELIKNLK